MDSVSVFPMVEAILLVPALVDWYKLPAINVRARIIDESKRLPLD